MRGFIEILMYLTTVGKKTSSKKKICQDKSINIYYWAKKYHSYVKNITNFAIQIIHPDN